MVSRNNYIMYCARRNGLTRNFVYEPMIKLPASRSLVERLLTAEGIASVELQAPYLEKLDRVCHRVSLGQDLRPFPPVARARMLYYRLWERKKDRYQSGGNFRLSQAVDAWLREDQGPIANCLGLTLLYDAVCQGFYLPVGGLYLPMAFDHGPHVCSLLTLPQQAMHIEHMVAEGFDYQGHRERDDATPWTEDQLVAEVYTALGNESMDNGNASVAEGHYRRAMELDPHHLTARLNLGSLLAAQGQTQRAEALFAEAALA